MSLAASATLTDTQLSLILSPLITDTLSNITTYSVTLTELLDLLPTILPIPTPPSHESLIEIKTVLLRFRVVKMEMECTRTAINSIKNQFVGKWVDEMVVRLEEGWTGIVAKRDEAEKSLEGWSLKDLEDVYLDEDCGEWEKVEGE